MHEPPSRAGRGKGSRGLKKRKRKRNRKKKTHPGKQTGNVSRDSRRETDEAWGRCREKEHNKKNHVNMKLIEKSDGVGTFRDRNDGIVTKEKTGNGKKGKWVLGSLRNGRVEMEGRARDPESFR